MGEPRLGETWLVGGGRGTGCAVVGKPRGGSMGSAGVGVFPGECKLLPVVVVVTVAVSARLQESSGLVGRIQPVRKNRRPRSAKTSVVASEKR